jgi:RimJ/RimL family protein N-acetyltransferase
MSAAEQSAVRLSLPAEGLSADGVILRFPTIDDVDAILPAFTDPELREAGNLPAFDRQALRASVEELPRLAAAGRLLALSAVDSKAGEIVGGGTLHHLDVERRIVEIGYFVLPHARRRGFATVIARLLAEHAFSLGIERVAAYVNVGNTASERVVERAGFTREGVVRSMPKPDGRRVDKTLFSLLPGDGPARS